MKIERKKLILIIAGIASVLLLAVIVVISSLQQSSQAEPSPTPTVTTPPSNNNGNGEDEPGIPVIIEPGDENPPPQDMFNNDYSNDEGYLKLPEGFDGSVNPEGTVFDELWTIDAFNRLTCELASKETVTERALQPLRDFSADLRKVDYDSAFAFREMINRWLEQYERRIGDRPPATTSAEVSAVCDLAADVGELDGE